MTKNKQTQVVVIGSGPGGYAAAFRASDLGFKTILMDRYNQFSGKSICPVVRNMDEIIKLL